MTQHTCTGDRADLSIAQWTERCPACQEHQAPDLVAELPAYCPGFHLYDVTRADGQVHRQAADNPCAARDFADMAAGERMGVTPLADVVLVGPNPEADRWIEARGL